MGEPIWPDDATPEQIARITRKVDGFLKVRPPRNSTLAKAVPGAPVQSSTKAKKSKPKG